MSERKFLIISEMIKVNKIHNFFTFNSYMKTRNKMFLHAVVSIVIANVIGYVVWTRKAVIRNYMYFKGHQYN